METYFTLKTISASVFYSLLGITIFILGFIGFDKYTPYNLWKEIVEEKNIALAIIVGAVAIGISLIISSAIHG